MGIPSINERELVSSVALVTGGASGIGARVAERLAAQGARVAVVDIDHARADSVAGNMRRKGLEAKAFVVDVSSAESVDRMVDEVVTHYGGLDMAVNGAGVPSPKLSLDACSEDVWRRVLSTNLDGVFYSMRREINAMREEGGSIVNISSILGCVGMAQAASFTTIDVNGGAIDGSPIGANSASTGAFTTLSTTGLATLATVDINGGAIDGTAIGATTASTVTASTVTATTVTASGNVNTTGGELQINGTNVLEKVYPVGSIYINASVNTNPATLLGFGTWVAFGAGKVIVGLDSGDTDFDTVGETGGAKTVTLTASQIPEHTHNLYVNEYQGGDDAAWANNATDGRISGNNINRQNRTSTANSNKGAQIIGGTAQELGTSGGSAHNNLQPYIVAYMWKRTV